MGLSLAFHLIAAWFSVGHHSADEYFQILEFLSYKRGLTPAYDLPVEFHEQMRPWMQPFIYGLITRAWEALGVHNPFTWAWSFRLITGLLGWAATVGLALRSRKWFSDPIAQQFCVIGLAVFWFLPALHVRPSSESLAGSAFLCALVLLTGPTPRYFLAGVFMGISFEARFQLALMSLGLFAWLIFIGPSVLPTTFSSRIKKSLPVLAGLALIIAIGRWIDHWGYGQWVISPWRYFEYNLLRGEVNRFGRSPFWDVFRMSFTESWPFLGLGLAIASCVAWIRHPRHPLTWSHIPFFLVHEVIAHKELRFFFPIALAGPVLLTLSLTSARTGRFTDPACLISDQILGGWPAKLGRAFWRFLIINNFIALIALLFLPFSRPIQFFKSIWDFIPQNAARFEILYRNDDPYHLLGNPIYFYHPPSLVTLKFNDYADLIPRLRAQETLWIFIPQISLPSEAAPIASSCQPAIRSLPEWVTHFNFNHWLERAHPYTLFKCVDR